MAAQDAPAGPLKVFLWTTPRSCSTTFLKCMTFVPDAVAWHEPYMQIAKFSLQVEDPMFSEPYRELIEKQGGASAVAEIESGFDAIDKDFDWLKEQLEGDFPGKKLVFVKDMGASIGRESLQDKIPKGFRHTFLIRNPRKMMKSQLKGFIQRQAPDAFKNPNITPDRIRPNQHLNDLWKYVKSEGMEPHPIIIDTDELLENPKEILEAYCKEVGIPFTEDLLTWEAGDDVMTKHWMVPKQTILTYRKVGVHGGTFASTGFHKPPASTTNGSDSDQLLKQIPSVVTEILDGVANRELPYYEELFAERLTINKK